MINRRFFFFVCAAAVVVLGQPSAARAQGKDGLKFEIYRDAADAFRWRLKAANGEVLATAGQGYRAKSDCQKGVERIQKEVGTDKLAFELYEDNTKEQRWRLKSANGQIVATSSQGYKNKSDCENAIDLIKKGAAKAEVEDKS